MRALHFYIQLYSPYIRQQLKRNNHNKTKAANSIRPQDKYQMLLTAMSHLNNACAIFVVFFLFSSHFFLFSSPNLSRRRSQIGCLPYFHTWCGLSANLECISEMCCRWLAGNAGPKKSPKIRHLGTITQICRAISSQLRHVSTCHHNMVNFGPLAAEIVPVVWGTPADFNGFRVLAALLHGTLVVGVSQTLRRWTEGATYIR